jgi:hypothetical protein
VRNEENVGLKSIIKLAQETVDQFFLSLIIRLINEDCAATKLAFKLSSSGVLRVLF